LHIKIEIDNHVFQGDRSFAGAGGFSEAAEMSGINVAWAGNHWKEAVAVHEVNHPNTAHICQDLHQANWMQVPEHDIMLASPSCTGHTMARGKERSGHDNARSTAWAPVSCAEYHRPKAFVIENVAEMASKWVLFPAWKFAMEQLGYSLSMHMLDAADYGVPQHRTRLIIVGVQGKHPLPLRLEKREHIPAASFVNFDAGIWTPVHHPRRAPATLARAEAGRRQFGERFIMPFYGSGSGKTGRCLSRPIGTITTRDRWAVVDGDRMRMLMVEEAQAAMSFRRDYRLPCNKKLAMHMLGNAIPPKLGSTVLQAMLKVL
jgi:DNA (cytosine-5)-methyltransferase 1